MEQIDILEIMDHPDAEEVGQGSWVDVERPEKAYTAGLGPCAGVLVHNPKEASAVLGHFVDPRMKVEDFYGLVKHARGRMGKVVDQVVYLSGVAPEDSRQRSLHEARGVRKFVKEAFLQSGYQEEQIRASWNKVDHAATMAVDTESGKVVVSHSDYSHLSDLSEEWDR